MATRSRGRETSGVAKRMAIGVAWWLAASYAFEFGAFMYGFPTGLGSIAAVSLAVLIAGTRPQPRRRPADLRRIYQPQTEPGVVGVEAPV